MLQNIGGTSDKKECISIILKLVLGSFWIKWKTASDFQISTLFQAEITFPNMAFEGIWRVDAKCLREARPPPLLCKTICDLYLRSTFVGGLWTGQLSIPFATDMTRRCIILLFVLAGSNGVDSFVSRLDRFANASVQDRLLNLSNSGSSHCFLHEDIVDGGGILLELVRKTKCSFFPKIELRGRVPVVPCATITTCAQISGPQRSPLRQRFPSKHFWNVNKEDLPFHHRHSWIQWDYKISGGKNSEQSEEAPHCRLRFGGTFIASQFSQQQSCGLGKARKSKMVLCLQKTHDFHVYFRTQSRSTDGAPPWAFPDQ